MCLAALLLNPDPKESGYRLVLAFNRDEFYQKPTKSSDFWQCNPNIISGQDMTEGREGGTWLGMTTSGRLAMVLNVLQPDGTHHRPQSKGKGSLVSNFLQGSLDGQSYLRGVAEEQHLYNGFNLITIELGKSGDTDSYYHTNFALSEIEPARLKPGIHAFSNHPANIFWPKTDYVQSELEKLLTSCDNLSKGELTEEILALMMHQEPLTSGSKALKEDVNISSASIMKEDILKELIFVKFDTFGTRSTTVILVDSAGNVSYTERSLKEPIDPHRQNWHQQTHTFTIL